MDAGNPPDDLEVGEILVFVYGTLLRGQRNHGFLAGARYVGDARTAPEFGLVDVGGFPALVEGGRTEVSGEVYAVDAVTLRLLDELEDHPDYYRRTRILLADGRAIQSYVLPDVQASCFPRIPSGSWRDGASA